MSECFGHIPVLHREVAELLKSGDKPAKLIDATLGNGGHSKILLEANPSLEVLGIDRDEAALDRARGNLKEFGARVRYAHGRFSEIGKLAEQHGFGEVDRILMDIGVSSPQLDDSSRGFSWRFDGPLDMRMDRTESQTASRLLNHLGVDELCRIFREYGEVKHPMQLARGVVEAREQKPFSTTGEFAELCDRVLGRARRGSIPAPTLAFQALRIAVNDELGELQTTLPEAVRVLKTGGILAVISFHSLEDRIVKNFFRDRARNCVCPPDFPVCVCSHRAELRVLTAKAITARADEIENNRRSACAKLRAAEKLSTAPAGKP